nr:hypothetical protein [Burkholderia sp. BCC1047]
MGAPTRVDRDALPLGHAGARSSFLLFVTRAEPKCGMPACDIPVEQDPSAARRQSVGHERRRAAQAAAGAGRAGPRMHAGMTLASPDALA